MRISTSGSLNREKGFTLIELTVVVFIIGLLFFITVPRLGNFLFQTDLKSVVRSLKAQTYFLRSKSIATHRNTAIHFDLTKGLYWGTYVTSQDDPATVSKPLPLIPPQRLPEGIRFMDASNMNSPKRELGLLSSTFNPKGIFEETVLHLADKNNKIFTIIINAYTGRFMLYDEYVDVEYGAE